jgi:hypothetical protein
MFARPPRVEGVYLLTPKGLSVFERLEAFPTTPEMLPHQTHFDYPPTPAKSPDDAEDGARVNQNESGAWCFENGSEGCFDQFRRICFHPSRGITETYDEVGGNGGLTTLRYTQMQPQ